MPTDHNPTEDRSNLLTRRPILPSELPWQRVATGPVPYARGTWQAAVADGHLTVITSLEPTGWHLSISHRLNVDPPIAGRYPTWDEIAEAREKFLPDDRTFAMLLPPRSEYVNLHQTTFHLWEMP